MKRVIFVLLSLLLFTSCKREDIEDPETKTWTRYYPKKVGSYWIYEVGTLNTASPTEFRPMIDSVVSDGRDTTMWGMRYEGFSVYRKEYDRPFTIHARKFFRDSCGYLVTHRRYIMFSEHDLNRELYLHTITANGIDTIAYTSYRMVKPDQPVQVPAGTFTNLLNYQGSYFRKKPSGFVEATVKMENIYARDIGLIYSQVPWDAGDNLLYVTKLIRYHIE